MILSAISDAKQHKEADVVIIGSGTGGATCGYALAKAGRSVLFLERGGDLSLPGALRGTPPEALPEFSRATQEQRKAILLRAGRNPNSFADAIAGDDVEPFIGCGTGGSSSLFGMVLERRLPHDFDGWPIGYEDLAPWYAKAELLYEVCGSQDPLRSGDTGCSAPPVPLSLANETMFHHLRSRGLHPYRLHLACRRLPDCNSCQGFLCPSEVRCKNDAATACLTPALKLSGTSLMTDARVLRLESSNGRIEAAVVDCRGTVSRVRGKQFVLAAGALATPLILLASSVRNRSGLIGRRLMRHAIDLFVLALGPRYQLRGESKELALNDFYAPARNALGTVQAFGSAPPLGYLRNQPGRNLWRTLGPAAVPIYKLFAGAPIVAGILDDRPSPDNRVEPHGDSGRITWRLSPEDAERRWKLRMRILRAFARFGPVPVFGTTDRKALGHVCGTAVFGDQPENSVLDRHNRVHEFSNLYVVDASFFPTSGGVNPALTIAANSLRVADLIHREEL